MKVIALVSMKGGVGKTSLTACLAKAFLNSGRPVWALDLDSQNALGWHLGIDPRAVPGVARQAAEAKRMRAAAITTPSGIQLIPYGEHSAPQRLAFEAVLQEQPGWLQARLRGARFAKDSVMFVDTPPGASVYLDAALQAADVVLPVVLPDGASYATVPAMEAILARLSALRTRVEARYVINQHDEADALKRDVARALTSALGERLLTARVHQDDGVAEALAFQKTVLDLTPHSQASVDVGQLAAAVQGCLR